MVQVICINLLNCLILTVGKLYWGAVRLYLLGREVDLESQRGVLVFYRKKMKHVFTFVYGFAAACVISSAFLLVYAHGDHMNANFSMENAINFIVAMFCIIIFLFSRLHCYYVIQKNREISKSQIRKEFVYTFFVFLTCALRITIYWLSILKIDPSSAIRTVRSTDCYDDQPWHALYIISLTIFVNQLPAFIFLLIFREATTEPVYEGLKATLSETYFNSQV